MNAKRMTILVLCLVLCPALLLAGPDPDPVRVENPAQPAQGVERVELEKQWSVGGIDDEENIFGVVTRALLDDEGNIYLLDGQLSQVNVFSPDGEFIKTLGREGDGPGEFRGPVDMCFLPNGNLGVVQAFPGKIVELTKDDQPAGTWQLGDPTQGGFFIMRALKSGGGVMVGGGTKQSFDQASGEVRRTNFVGRMGEDGSLQHSFVEIEHVLNVGNLKLDELEVIESPDRRYDVTGAGKTVVAEPRYGYEISVYDPDGNLERVFSREYESWKRDERAMTMWENIFDFIQTNQAPGAAIHIEDYQPDVEFLRVGADGSTYVLTSRAMWESPEGIFTSYDVFDAEGVYQKKLDIICEGDPTQDFLFFADDETVFMVKGFWDAALSQFGGTGGDDEEADPMEVICYRVK